MSYKLIHSYDTFRLLVQYLAYTMFVVSSRMMPRHGKQTSKHFLFPKLKCEILTLSLWRVCLVEGRKLYSFQNKVLSSKWNQKQSWTPTFQCKFEAYQSKKVFFEQWPPLHLTFSTFSIMLIRNKQQTFTKFRENNGRGFSPKHFRKATKLGRGEQQKFSLSETKMFSKHFSCSLAKI